jgi:glycosyltransferase involved in cell wall biosynthesis
MKYNTNHTFVVCAYKESPYLEECINSLVSQTVKSNIEIYTSTPNEYIDTIAAKYHVPVYVNESSETGIQNDWNYAYNHATTDYVTVAHQDDVYDKDYVKYFLHYSRKYSDWTIFFTDYTPIKHGISGKRDANSIIRRLLRMPVKNKNKADKEWRKKSILCLGNSIVCPLVTYNKKNVGDTVFTSQYGFNLDWDTFLKLAQQKGRFLYVDRVLGHYRVHDGATSKDFIENHNREIEDISMFEKFWPKWVVRIIMVFYKLAYKTYD